MAIEGEASIVGQVMQTHPTEIGTPLLTAEEFARQYGGEKYLELVEGRVVRTMPGSPRHGNVDSNLAMRLGTFVADRGLGKVYLNTGFILARGPDVVRGPDEAFVALERIKTTPPPERGFWEIAPDLAAEIVSPENTADEVAQKVTEYLRAGVKLIWVIYPRQKQVHVFRPGRDPKILGGDDFVEGEDVVTGFRIPLTDLWS